MKRYIDIFGALCILGALLVWIFYPDIPRSVLGWISLFVLGIPAWLFLEWFGGLITESKFMKKRSSFTRILIGIPIVIFIGAVAIFTINLVQRGIAFVGG